MGEETKIEWARSTFNPWWGCEKVSPACAHCYAERDSIRYGQHVWGQGARRMLSDKHWQQPITWNKKAEASGQPWRVFCGSMCDVMEDREDLDAQRHRLWNLIDMTPHLTWMLLTKRPQNYHRFLPAEWWGEFPKHVWPGTTVENQATADERIPELLKVPGVRWLSMEPLLEEVDISPWLWKIGCEPHCGDRCSKDADCPMEPAGQIHLVITGGETGPQARPSNPVWFRHLRDQSRSAGVAFFFKQWGEWAESPDQAEVVTTPAHDFPEGHRVFKVGKEAAGRLLDGSEWNEIPGAQNSDVDLQRVPSLHPDPRDR